MPPSLGRGAARYSFAVAPPSTSESFTFLRSTLPISDFGSSSTKNTWRGTLYGAEGLLAVGAQRLDVDGLAGLR